MAHSRKEHRPQEEFLHGLHTRGTLGRRTVVHISPATTRQRHVTVRRTRRSIAHLGWLSVPTSLFLLSFLQWWSPVFVLILFPFFSRIVRLALLDLVCVDLLPRVFVHLINVV